MKILTIFLVVLSAIMVSLTANVAHGINTTTIIFESFDFSTNTHGGFDHVTGGDLYYLPIDAYPLYPQPIGNFDKFWANNAGQRGLQDIGAIPLMDITTIPAAGYYQFGVSAVIGDSYISLAQQGEEGFYIFFRVVDMTTSSVTIDWIYDNRAPGSAVPEPTTMILLGSGLLSLVGLRRKFRR